MIPLNWLNTLENYKQKTYDEVNALFLEWLNGLPLHGRDAYGSALTYWQDWENDNHSLNKGWNVETYYNNLINGDTHYHPQSAAVAEYAISTLKDKWVSVDNYTEDFIDSVVNKNSGTLVDSDINKLKSDYLMNTTELNKLSAAKKKERERLLAIVDAEKTDLTAALDVKKLVNEYWKGWDDYLNLYNKDVTDYKNKWQETLEAIRNKETEPEPIEEPKVELSTLEEEKPSEEKKQEAETLEPETNVFSDSEDNAYLSVTKDDGLSDVSVNETHTRIYEYMASTIELDEMSIPVIDSIDSNGTIDPSTGLHLDSSSNMNSTPFTSKGVNSTSKALSIGFTYPLLRINDHYFTDADIKYFSLETVGFIPTIEVTIECPYNDIIKTNMIKDGDLCSVFMNPGHGTIKSYRGDFLITSVKVPKINLLQMNSSIKIRFIGELFIPAIYDATLTFSFAGSSRDALINVAEKLGLGFFFSDPENTDDVQMWYSMSDGELKSFSNSSPTIEYIKNTALHAWKNFESFFDCWIDPRYAISFINIAQMLGGSGLDEAIDLALFNSGLTAGRHVDAKNREATDESKVNDPRPLAKILTNISTTDAAITPFLVISFSEKNDGSITNLLGLSNANYYNIKNTGILKVEDNLIEMNLSIPVNADKLKHGFYIMAGPGLNLTYTQADNGSYVDLHKSVQGGQIAETQSDEDATDISESGNNMLAAGNTNKFYETADGHNTLCNAWLKKKTIEVTLNGCNMQIMRGEKIPMFLKDNSSPELNLMLANNSEEMIYQKVLTSCTGWFIIKNIKWIYDRDHPSSNTQWRTELTLTRREWPIPGYVEGSGQGDEVEKNANNLYVENNINSGTVKEAELDLNNQINENKNLTKLESDESTSDNLTTNGLNEYMKTIYNDIVEACSQGGKKIKLVSGRRWFVDDDDNIVEMATVLDGNLWKFKNANGDIVWYSSKTSPHNTGDAIDIINDEGTKFEEVAQYIILDNKTLYDMITNGVYLALEVSKDDIGNTIKHYHIGKVDKSNSDTITAQSNWWLKLVKLTKSTINYNGKEIQVALYLTYSNK